MENRGIAPTSIERRFDSVPIIGIRAWGPHPAALEPATSPVPGEGCGSSPARGAADSASAIVLGEAGLARGSPETHATRIAAPS